MPHERSSRMKHVLAVSAATAVVALAASGVGAQQRDASRPAKALSPDDGWDTFTTEVSISTSRVDRAGKNVQPALPPLRYRMVRFRGNRGWRTTLTILRDGPPRLLTTGGAILADDSHELDRIEEPEDGGAPTYYNRAGRVMQAPQAPDLPWGPATPETQELRRRLPQGRPASSRRIAPRDTSWVESFMPHRLSAPGRRAKLRQAHGEPRGRTRGFDRFVVATDDQVHEVLADAEWGLTREVNTIAGSQLVSHRTVEYEPGPGSTLVRRRMRNERRIADDSGHRHVTEIHFANTRLEQAGGGR